MHVCAAHSEALRLSFLSFATPIEDQGFHLVSGRQLANRAATAGTLGCTLSATGFYSILEYCGVCDRKDAILPVKLVDEIVEYILDGNQICNVHILNS